MKTAISLPDDTFDRATRRAGELGVSRPDFFATAAQRYLDELDAQSVTEQSDRALTTLPEPDGSSTDAVAAGRALLISDDDW